MFGSPQRLRFSRVDDVHAYVSGYGFYDDGRRERITAIAPRAEWERTLALAAGDKVLISPDRGHRPQRARTHLILMLATPPRSLEVPTLPNGARPIMVYTVLTEPKN